MKKILTISIIITSLIFLSCRFKSENEETTQQTEKINSPIIQNFTKSFTGTINEKYEISMTLSKSAKKLNGTYYYKSQGIPIKISGMIDDSGNLTLSEYNNGNITGIFNGQLSSNNFIGIWTSQDGHKKMRFSLTEAIKSETTFAIKESNNNDDDYSNWTGTYTDEFNRTLKIKGPSSDGSVIFELTPQYSASCAEDLWTGIAYLSNSSVANYIEEGGECHFNFTFNPGQIQVQEYDCSHGATCGTFDGFYKKINK